MSRLKITRGPAKAGGRCLIFLEFVILMRNEMGYLKNGLCPNLSCVSSKISEKSENYREVGIFPKT